MLTFNQFQVSYFDKKPKQTPKAVQTEIFNTRHQRGGGSSPLSIPCLSEAISQIAIFLESGKCPVGSSSHCLRI